MRITNAITKADERKLRFKRAFNSAEYVLWGVLPEWAGAGRVILLQIGKRGQPLSPRVQANFWHTSQTELLHLLENDGAIALGRCEEMVYTKP